MTLHLPPGTVLREDELMKDLGIGRTPLREAVKRLALENLVEVQPRRGTFVTAIEAADIQGITEVRAELEGTRPSRPRSGSTPDARHVRRRSSGEIESLDGAGEQESLMRMDERIHRFVWDAARNPYLTETLERYFTHSLRIWYLVLTACRPWATRCTTRPSCSRRCSTGAAPTRGRSCTSTCWPSSATILIPAFSCC